MANATTSEDAVLPKRDTEKQRFAIPVIAESIQSGSCEKRPLDTI